MYFFSTISQSIYLTNRFDVAVRQFSSRSQMTLNVVRTKSGTQAIG